MQNKTSLFILSALLLISFFAPNIEWEGFAMSGFDFVVSSLTPDIKYILLIVPACAFLLMISALSDGSIVAYNRLILQAPIAVFTLLLMLFFLNNNTGIVSGSVNPLRTFYMGLWIALPVSVILAISRGKKIKTSE